MDAYSFNTGNGQDAVAGLSADSTVKVGRGTKKVGGMPMRLPVAVATRATARAT